MSRFSLNSQWNYGVQRRDVLLLFEFSGQIFFVIIVLNHCTFFFQLKPKRQAANLISVQHSWQNWIKSSLYFKEMLYKNKTNKEAEKDKEVKVLNKLHKSEQSNSE